MYCCQHFLRWSLKGQLILTSRYCSTEVQPPGMTMTVVLQRANIAWISSVRCALKLSSTSSDGRFFVYCTHTFVVHCFMISSSIHAFSWYVITIPLWSIASWYPHSFTPFLDTVLPHHFFLVTLAIHLVVIPLKIIIGGSMSHIATQDNTAVICHFSNFVVQTMIDFLPYCLQF